MLYNINKNLFKSNWVVVHDEELRIIDNNALSEMKMKAVRPQPEVEAQSHDMDGEEGFSEGIPSEHLEALLDVDADSDSNVIKGVSREERDALLAEIEQAKSELQDLRAQADRMIEDAHSEIEEMKAQAYEEAKEKGYQDGHAQGMQEAEAVREECLRKDEQRARDYQQQIENLEPRFIEELTDIYEHIFKVEISRYHELVSSLLSNAIQKIDGTKNYMIHVSKEDYQNVTGNKERLRSETGGGNVVMEIIEDVTLSQSQCFIETENGIYDCSLDTQLKELARKLKLLSYEKYN